MSVSWGANVDWGQTCNHICPQDNSEPVADATVLDGAVMEHQGHFKTMDTMFAPYIAAQLEINKCVDLVWDVYLSTSLKTSTRQKWGKGHQEKRWFLLRLCQRNS